MAQRLLQWCPFALSNPGSEETVSCLAKELDPQDLMDVPEHVFQVLQWRDLVKLHQFAAHESEDVARQWVYQIAKQHHTGQHPRQGRFKQFQMSSRLCQKLSLGKLQAALVEPCEKGG